MRPCRDEAAARADPFNSIVRKPRVRDFGFVNPTILSFLRSDVDRAERFTSKFQTFLVIFGFVSLASALTFYGGSQLTQYWPLPIVAFLVLALGYGWAGQLGAWLFVSKRDQHLAGEIKKYDSALAEWRQLKDEWEYRNLETKEGFWRPLRGIDFEQKLAKLFKARGCDVETTKVTGDGGVDLIVRTNDGIFSCQCKGHQKPISVGAIREIAGVCSRSEHWPVIFAVNGFTEPARTEAASLGVLLFDARDYAYFATKDAIYTLQLQG